MKNTKIVSSYDELLLKSINEPLSKLFPLALLLAIEIKNANFSKWLRLEMNGYWDTNQALTEDVEVPKYRTIAGQHKDHFGQILVVSQKNFDFVNTRRIRNGVEELERFSITNNNLTIQDPHATEILKKNFDFDAVEFSFNPIQLVSVINAIRTRFIEWLTKIQPSIDNIRKSIEKNAPNVNASKKKEKKWYQHPVVIAALITASGAIITAIIIAIITNSKSL